jgi:hypothetical protein
VRDRSSIWRSRPFRDELGDLRWDHVVPKVQQPWPLTTIAEHQPGEWRPFLVVFHDSEAALHQRVGLAAFMVAIFFIGLLSFGFRLEKTAYRYASVTLTIIVLIPRANPAWIVGLHRFIEVSVGIIVALLVVAIWPERSPIAAKNADQ